MANKDNGAKPSPLFLKIKEPKVFEFGKVVHHNFKLLEVSEKLLEEIEKDGVSIKGSLDKEAVLTTKDKTFMLKLVETTNLQLLVAPPRLPTDASSPSERTNNPVGNETPNGKSNNPPSNSSDSASHSEEPGLSRFQQGDPNKVTASAITTAHIELVEIAPNFGNLQTFVGTPYVASEVEQTARRLYRSRKSASSTAVASSSDPSNNATSSAGLGLWSRLVARQPAAPLSNPNPHKHKMRSTDPGDDDGTPDPSNPEGESDDTRRAMKKLRGSRPLAEATGSQLPRPFKTLEELHQLTQASRAEVLAELDRLGCVAMPLSYCLDSMSDDSTLVWRIVDPNLTAEILDIILLTAQQELWNIRDLSEADVFRLLAFGRSGNDDDEIQPTDLTDGSTRYPPELLRHCLSRFGSKISVEPQDPAAGAGPTESTSAASPADRWALNADKLHRHYAQRVMSRVTPSEKIGFNDAIQRDPPPFNGAAPSWSAARSMSLADFLGSWLQELEKYVAFAYPTGSEDMDEANGTGNDPGPSATSDASSMYLDPPTLDILGTEVLLDGLPSVPEVDQTSLAHVSALIGIPSRAKDTPAPSGAAWSAAALAAAEHPDAASVSVRLLRLDELPLDPSDRFQILFKVRPRWFSADLKPFIKDIKVPGQSAEALLLRYARASQPSKDSPVVFSVR